MGEKSQVDDNVSSNDHICQEFISSVGANKTSKQNSRDAGFSAVSSEFVLSANRTLIRSDLSLDIGSPLKEKRKHPSSTSEEISQGDSAMMVPCPHKQLKADSSTSKNSGAVGQLSSVDSIDPIAAHVLNDLGHSLLTVSVESNKVFQDTECSITRSSHCGFDLNEGMDVTRANCDQKSVNASNYSGNAVLSEPIPVVAKMGVPIGMPKKPLQFGGDLGWKRSGITSAFRATSLTSPYKENMPVSKGFDFDLNVPATMDLEVVEEALMDVNSKFYHHRENEKFLRPDTRSIDLNNHPTIEDTYKTIYPRDETRQFLPVTCSGGNGGPYTPNCPRPPYWVDLSSIQGFGNVQGQHFLLGGPTTEQVQMVVPIQMPYTPPGLYMQKMSNLTPAFYPPNVLPPPHNQPGPILAAYPGNVRLLENSHGLNLNMRQAILSNGSMALVENGSRAGNSSEFYIPTRNPLFEDRMKPVEQVAGPSSLGTSQMNYRQMALWN